MELNPKEQELYNFITNYGEVTIDTIRTHLSEKHIGALGRLMRMNKVEKYKKRSADTYKFSKMITYYGIKEEKNENTGN